MTEGMIIGCIAAAAAIAGPLLAVWITRMSDERNAAIGRRMDIFRTLMRTRRLPIHYEHVGALNLIEIEFAHDLAVISAWKKYLEKLNIRLPIDAPKEQHDDLIDQRRIFLTKLISAISKSLKLKVEQLDILEGNYVPQGWSDDEAEQRVVRQSLIQVLGGRRALLFQPYNPASSSGPYPPAPPAMSPPPDPD